MRAAITVTRALSADAASRASGFCGIPTDTTVFTPLPASHWSRARLTEETPAGSAIAQIWPEGADGAD